jgi:O-antigen/teichoic acid export membrane protein
VSVAVTLRGSWVRARLAGLIPFISSTAVLAAGPVLQLATFAIITRSVNEESFAAYIAVTSTVAILGELVGLGSGDRLVRAVVRRSDEYARYMANALWLTALTTPVLLLLHVIVQAMYASPDASMIAIVAAALVELPATRIIATCEQAAIGHRQFHLSNLLRFLNGVVRLSVLAVAALLGMIDGLLSVLLVGSTGAVLSASLCYQICRRRYGRVSGTLIHNEISPGASLALVQLVRGMQQNLDRLILSGVLAAGPLATYAVGMRVVQAGYLPLQAALRIVYPGYFSAAATTGSRGSVSYGLRQLPWLLLVSVATGVALCLSTPLIPVLFGEAFSGSKEVVLAAGWIWVLLAANYVGGDILVGSDRHHLRTAAALTGAVVQACLLFMFASQNGARGAIWALYAAALASTIITWGMVWLTLRTRSAGRQPGGLGNEGEL